MAGSTQAKIPSQLGRTAVVTGATGGLGYETALALAKAGSEVILTGRDDRKGQSAIEKISREVTGAKVSYEHLDLASLASVADFAQRMHARQSLDLLINNAGVMALPRRQTTADGFEMQFGTNCAGQADQGSSASAAWRTVPGSSISMICRAHGCIRHGRHMGNRSSQR
jgi:NAD(P)-dependent dehydrogenase (short-subunit alcohol dehydrogenase family)